MSQLDLTIRTYSTADYNKVVSLWQATGLLAPQNDPLKDIERKIHDSPDLFLVGELVSELDEKLGRELVATVMGGYDGHRGWVNYLAVDPANQGRGVARAMMETIKQRLSERGCPKINLQVRTSNTAALGFYQRLGYQQDNVVSLGLRLEQD